MKKNLLLIPLIFLMVQLYGQTSQDSSIEWLKSVRTKDSTILRTEMLCDCIAGMSASSTEGYAFKYERVLYTLAGVTKEEEGDFKTVSKKIRVWWAKHKNELNCSAPPRFIEGNVIKFAIQTNFREFIEDLVDWGCDLNIDDGTGKTIIQYIDEQLRIHGNDSLTDDLKDYKTMLLKAMEKQGLNKN